MDRNDTVVAPRTYQVLQQNVQCRLKVSIHTPPTGFSVIARFGGQVKTRPPRAERHLAIRKVRADPSNVHFQ
jgi:hypothetical protein